MQRILISKAAKWAFCYLCVVSVHGSSESVVLANALTLGCHWDRVCCTLLPPPLQKLETKLAQGDTFFADFRTAICYKCSTILNATAKSSLYYCWTSSQNALPSWMPLQRTRSTIAEHPPKMPYHPECHCKELALLLLNIPKCPTILNATAKSSLYYCWTSQNAPLSWMPLQRARSTIAEHPKMPYHPECHCKELALQWHSGC